MQETRSPSQLHFVGPSDAPPRRRRWEAPPGGFDEPRTESRFHEATSPADRGSQPIRILFVNDHLGYAGGVIHGATTYFFTTLPSFDRRRVEPHLCILRPWHPVAERFAAVGIAPIFLGRPKWDPRALTDLVRVIRERAIDLLHLSGQKGILLGRLAARLSGRPAIVHAHDTDRMRPWLRLVQHRLAGWTAGALAVSEPVRRVMSEEFGLAPERVEVLPNPVRLEMFANPAPDARGRVRRELGLAEATPVVGVTGRLIPGKGHAQLIEAMLALRARCPEAVLIVAGEGPTRRDCEALVESLGLSGAVRFIGHRDDIPDLLAALDVVAVPSMCIEGFGYSALEASVAGRPVVAFASGGLTEVVVPGKSGLLVPRGDVEGLARALGDVLANADLARALGQGGRRHARRFSVERHVARLTELYAAAVADRRRATAQAPQPLVRT